MAKPIGAKEVYGQQVQADLEDFLGRLASVVDEVGHGNVAESLGWSRMKLWRVLHGKSPLTMHGYLSICAAVPLEPDRLLGQLGW